MYKMLTSLIQLEISTLGDYLITWLTSGYLQILVTNNYLSFFFMYLVHLPVYKTRLSIIWSILQPSHLLFTLLFSLIGGGCAYCLAELAGYHGLWSSCYGSVTSSWSNVKVFLITSWLVNFRMHHCLNEHQIFCTLYGTFSVWREVTRDYTRVNDPLLTFLMYRGCSMVLVILSTRSTFSSSPRFRWLINLAIFCKIAKLKTRQYLYFP